jgi:hypothetical protein
MGHTFGFIQWKIQLMLDKGAQIEPFCIMCSNQFDVILIRYLTMHDQGSVIGKCFILTHAVEEEEDGLAQL